MVSLPLSRIRGRTPRQLHKQLRLGHDIFVENDLWDGVGAGDLDRAAEELFRRGVFLYVEGEVGDVVGRQSIFQLLARRTPLGSEGDDSC